MANHEPRKYAISIVLSLLLLTTFKVMADGNPSNRITRVVIDAGHGGVDPGAVGSIAKEKDITLSVALKVGFLIEKNFPDVQITYTRKEDVFIPLNERADIANKVHADLFISIHVNSNPNKDAVGVETYVMGMHTTQRNMEVAMKENAVITYEKDYKSKYEGYDPHSAESFIVFSLVQNVHLDQSLSLAALMQEHSKMDARRFDRGVKQAGFLVLWRTTMPSVLVELGFLSNKKEEQYLLTESGQNDLASSVYNSFARYKQNLEHTQTAVYLPQTADSDIVSGQKIFRIQIISSKKVIKRDSRDFENCKKISDTEEIKEFNIEKAYKYAIGKKNDYAEAQKMLKEVKKYFPDAFIICDQNGNLIPLQDSKKK